MSADPLDDIFRPKRSMMQRFFIFWAKVAAGVVGFFVLFAVIFYFGVKADDQRQVEQASAAAAQKAQADSALDAALRDKRLLVGMTPQHVAVVMGYPREKTQSGGVGREILLWHYDDATLTFVDGGLTRWTFSR
ncbi:MAG TPA: hypothetical protein VGD88_06140 [Opitutaceae bacterium]